MFVVFFIRCHGFASDSKLYTLAPLGGLKGQVHAGTLHLPSSLAFSPPPPILATLLLEKIYKDTVNREVRVQGRRGGRENNSSSRRKRRSRERKSKSKNRRRQGEKK